VAIAISIVFVCSIDAISQSRSICFQAGIDSPWAQNADSALNIDLDFGGDTVDNQGVHPDIAFWPDSFGPNPGATVIGINSDSNLDTIMVSPGSPKWRYWMVFTPYPYDLAHYEDPCVRASNQKEVGWIRPYAFGDDPTDSSSEDDTVWVRDPIYDHHHFPSNVHSSDPEFLYSPEDGKLYVLFQSASRYRYKNYVKAIPSSDGITWDESQTFDFAVSEANDPSTVWNLLSPTVCRDTMGYWNLWFVDQLGLNNGTQLIRLRYPRIDGGWVGADTCIINPPDTGLQIWHTKIGLSPFINTLFLLATVNTVASSSSDTLGQYLYVSGNGHDWNLVGVILNNGPTGSWDYETYRSTFLFEHSAGKWTMPIWYSGNHTDSTNHTIWGIGYTEADIRWKYGDANGDCNINMLDITFLINFLYKHGLAPGAPFEGDIDGNCRINVLDVTYLVNFLYKHGITPAVGCD